MGCDAEVGVAEVGDADVGDEAQQARSASAVLPDLLAHFAPVGLVVDPKTLVITYVTPGLTRLLGWQPLDLIGRPGLSLVHPADAARVAHAWRAIVQGPTTQVTVDLRFECADRSHRWVQETVSKPADDPRSPILVMGLRDITQQVEAEQALRSSEARFRLIAETAQEGIITSDLQGRTLYANQRMADLLGLPLSDLYATVDCELATGGLHAEIARYREDTLSRGTVCFQMLLTRADGTRRTVEISASAVIDDGCHSGTLALITDVTDVTEALAAEDDLHHRASHDALTGLANRPSLLERLQRKVDGLDSAGCGSVAVLLADVDQFKLINESLGHAAGDELLIEVARRWRSVLRPKDVVARVGGDEFVVLCDNAAAPAARRVAERLRETLKEPVILAGRSVAVSASIGIAVAPAGGPASADALLCYADAAMFEAKSHGRGGIAVFAYSLIDRAQNQLRLFNDLKLAIEREDLQLHYQPIVELATGRILGVEALCRWTHSERGIIPPEIFIKIAEETGLIEALDRWALRRACCDGAAMRADGVLSADAYIAVNASAGHLSFPWFEAAVRAALIESGVPAEAFVLEVTESAVMKDPDLAQVALERLRGLGLEVSIDDFGTGYSSLAYLRRFPVATLKIDRSFVQGIANQPDGRAIVTAIVDLARAIGVSTIAEGIETNVERKLLQDLGCRAGQGFLWSQALSPAALADLVAGLPGGRFPDARARAAAAPPRTLPLARAKPRAVPFRVNR